MFVRLDMMGFVVVAVGVILGDDTIFVECSDDSFGSNKTYPITLELLLVFATLIPPDWICIVDVQV